MAKKELILFLRTQISISMSKSENIDKSIRLALQTSLLGEVYPELRAVAYSYDEDKKQMLIRYYLARVPTEEDYESISIVTAEFISFFHYETFQKIMEECWYALDPMMKLDPLDGFIYSRKEY